MAGSATSALEALLSRAYQYYEASDYLSAEVYCFQIMKADQNNTATLLLLACVHFQCGRLDKSALVCRRIMTLKPTMAEAYSNLGNVYKVKGDIRMALIYYKQSVTVQPTFLDGYLNLAATLAETGEKENAIQTYLRALHHLPENFRLMTDLGNLLQEMGRLEEAKSYYLQAIASRPDYIVLWNNLGCVYNSLGEIWLAIHHFDKAVKINPTCEVSQVNLGNVFKAAKIFDKAQTAYLAALAVNPTSPHLNFLVGSVYYEQDLTDLAIESFRKSVELDNNYPDAYCSLADALKKKDFLDEAEQNYNQALQLSPIHLNSLLNLAQLKRESGYLEEAMFLYRRALEIVPNCAETHFKLGSVLNQIGQLPEAAEEFKEAIRLNPAHAKALTQLGCVLWEMEDLQGAQTCYEQAILFNPSLPEPYSNLATIVKNSKKYSEAIPLYQTALKLKPNFPHAFCNLIYCLLWTCDWTDYDNQMQELVEIVNTQLESNAAPYVHPHQCFLYPFSHEQRKQIAAHYSKVCAERVGVLGKPPYYHPLSLTNQRLKIGYVSSDFRNHSTAHLMQSLPRFHRREFVEIYCYSLSPNDGSNFYENIRRTAENYVDLSGIGCNGKAADRIYKDGIHILINLNGHTKGARNEIFALRPAPIQVMWLGYPGTSGADYMDYIITDKTTSPLEFEEHFSEKLAYMPWTYFTGDHPQMFPHLKERLIIADQKNENVQDNLAVINALDLDPIMKQVGIKEIEEVIKVTSKSTQEIIRVSKKIAQLPSSTQLDALLSADIGAAHVNGLVLQNGLIISEIDVIASNGERVPRDIIVTTREQYDLPKDAMVFCNFNLLYKLDPPTLAMWVNILKRVPNSVLWLVSSPAADVNNIFNFCAGMGLDPGRVVFSPLAYKEEHVRRGQLADVCLDTPLCNGHTTCMDVLWTGTPVVTLPLETLASRVAASLLTCLGVPELIAGSRQEYEDMAVKLGTDKEYLKGIRAKVLKRRNESSLFDGVQFAANLERLYMKMWERYENGEEVDHITELSVI